MRDLENYIRKHASYDDIDRAFRFLKRFSTFVIFRDGEWVLGEDSVTLRMLRVAINNIKVKSKEEEEGK